MIKDYILQIGMAFFGSLGFAMLFHVKRKHMLIASLGGALGWIVYLLSMQVSEHLFVSTLCSSMFCTLYSEILARMRKAPVTVFLIPAVIPLIPGSFLYYTIYNMVQTDWTLAKQNGYTTAIFAIGIAVGISAVTAFWQMSERLCRTWEMRTEKQTSDNDR